MSEEQTTRYRGPRVVYIGEHDNCNATPRFFRLLDKYWQEVETVKIPQWEGIHDAMLIFERKP